MGRRWFVFVLAVLVMAGLILIGSFVYSSRVRTVESIDEGITVVVANQDIPPNTDLDPLIEANAFRVITVANDAAVEGAFTDIAQLRGETTAALIYRNEQIPLQRLQGIP